jgi:hypothetical protein
LETSKNNHYIQNTESPEQGNSNVADSESKTFSHTPQGSNTYYNPELTKDANGFERSSESSLAHEFVSHAFDADTGTTDNGTTKATNIEGNITSRLSNAEIDAVNIQNRAGAKLGDNKKTTYHGYNIPESKLLNTHNK